MKCFYHSADLDGRCSGAIVKRAYPDCEMIGIDYGQPFPWNSIQRDEPLIMVDFSLQPWSEMVRLDRTLRDVTWIDHHKSAIADHTAMDYPLFGHFVLDSDFAACELCWQTFFHNTAMPEAVHLLGRYDIWKHEDVTGALEFQYGMRAFADTSPESPIWSELFAGHWTDKIINDGITLLQYERNQNEAFCRAYAFECELDGLKCIAANRGMSNSLLFESVYDPAKHHAMLMFAWKGNSWTISLYSTREDVDCSIVCKARGGGGHKGAAGFQCMELPFLPKGERQ